MPITISPQPLVSFVMPVFNRAKVIERALDGVIKERAEHYPNLEIVVIDGGSKDGTVEILERYGDQIDYWTSEKDSGAAEAFNKGVKAAKGEIIRYVASDDEIVNGFTRRMVEHLLANPQLAVAGALANYFHVGPDGAKQIDPRPRPSSATCLDLRHALLWTKSPRFCLIETWFAQRRVFDEVGYLDTRYRVCPDWDFALRVVKSGLLFEVVPVYIVDKYFYADGNNLVADNVQLDREARLLLWRNAGFSWLGLLALYNWPSPLHRRLARSCKAQVRASYALLRKFFRNTKQSINTI